MKIFETIKEINVLSIFSFLLVVVAYLIGFLDERCGNGSSNLSFGAALLGIVALIYVKIKCKKGEWLALISILLGLIGSFIFVSFC